MDDRDRAIVAAAEGRAANPYAERTGWIDHALSDRRELLRIVREQDALLRERDTLAEDLADDAAAERATSGKWGG